MLAPLKKERKRVETKSGKTPDQFGRGQSVSVNENQLLIALTWIQQHTKDAKCHVVREEFDSTLYLAYLTGFLSVEMTADMQTQLESGLYTWWSSVDAYFEELDAARIGKQTVQTPLPMSMDLEIMRIFPLSACFLAAATLILMVEILYKLFCKFRT